MPEHERQGKCGLACQLSLADSKYFIMFEKIKQVTKLKREKSKMNDAEIIEIYKGLIIAALEGLTLSKLKFILAFIRA